MTVILSRSSRPLKEVEGAVGPDRLSPEISAPAAGKKTTTPDTLTPPFRTYRWIHACTQSRPA